MPVIISLTASAEFCTPATLMEMAYLQSARGLTQPQVVSGGSSSQTRIRCVDRRYHSWVRWLPFPSLRSESVSGVLNSQTHSQVANIATFAPSHVTSAVLMIRQASRTQLHSDSELVTTWCKARRVACSPVAHSAKGSEIQSGISPFGACAERGMLCFPQVKQPRETQHTYRGCRV